MLRPIGEKMYEKEKLKKERKLLKHCTLDSGGLLLRNPRLEVASSSVHGPLRSSSALIFMGRGDKKLVGG